MHSENGTSRRRDVLRAVGAAGVGLTVVGDVAATDDGVEIDTVRYRGRTLESEIVPKAWYRHETRVDTVAASLRQEYQSNRGVSGVGLTSTDRTVGGRFVTRPVVYTTDEASGLSVPSARDGIAIEQRQTPDPEPDTCYDQDYDTVPGAAQVENPNGGVFSATCRVLDSYDNPRLMTCAHGFDRCQGDGDIEYDDLEQSDQDLGFVDEWSVGQDWATVQLGYSSPVDGFDSGIAGTFRDFTGYVTRNGLKSLMSDDTTVYHNGRTTCKTEGTVTDIDVSFEICDGAYANNYVKTSAPTEPGDSGGPHYKQFRFNNDSLASLIAPHYGGESVGCAAYKIRQDHGFTFGGNYTL